MRCLHCFSSEKILSKHNCSGSDITRGILPKKGENILKFKNYRHFIRAPYVIYADFEALTSLLPKAMNNPDKSFTSNYQLHEACSFAYKVVSTDPEYDKDIVIYHGENAADEFMKSI